MGVLPTMSKIIQYANGGRIFISSIHPIIFETQELQNNEIDVVVSLMEEKSKPVFYKELIELKIRHFYYSCRDEPDFAIGKIYKTVFNTIYKALDYGRNILIQCRSGENFSVIMVIAFFLKVLHTDQQYLIYNFLYHIPKSRTNWTDSFLAFIKLYHPQANPSLYFMEELYRYETQLDYPLFGFKPLTLWCSE